VSKTGGLYERGEIKNFCVEMGEKKYSCVEIDGRREYLWKNRWNK